MVNRRAAATALAMVFAGGLMAFAQESPVPAIPWDLPDAPRLELEARRAPIMKRIEIYDGRVTAFMTKCGRVTNEALYAACAKENAALEAEEKAIDTAVAKFAAHLKQVLAAPCMDHERQLQRDMDAMRRQQRTNEMGFRELDEWTKASEEAQKAAIMVGAKTLLGNVAKHLESQEKSASAFLGWLSRYEKAMRTNGVPFEKLQGQIQTAMRGYVGAKTQAFGGAVLSKGLTLWTAWDTLTKIGGSVARMQSSSDTDVRAALNDPLFKAFLNTDATGRDLARGLLNMAVKAEPTAELKKLLPAYGVLTFAIDYGYEGSKWTAAYNRIVQQHKLADEQLRAVDALKLQIERTVASLQSCRASH